MNLKKLTHYKRTETHTRWGYNDQETTYTTTRWVARKWWDVTVGITCCTAIVAAIAGSIFGVGAGVYRISEVACHHKGEKYEVDNWSYGLSTGCNYEVEGKWMDSSKYPPTHVKVER